MYVCVLCECSAYGSQKRASDTLEIELQMVMRYFVGTRNQIYVLWKINYALYH